LILAENIITFYCKIIITTILLDHVLFLTVDGGNNLKKNYKFAACKYQPVILSKNK